MRCSTRASVSPEPRRAPAPAAVAWTVALLAVALLASCGSAAGQRNPTAAPTLAAPGPQPGGVLRAVWVPGQGDVAGALDPALAAGEAERQLLRATTRQLVSYDGVDSLAARQDPKPDLTTFSEISDDKTTFTFRLRDVRWPAPLDRPVVAADVVWAWKRLCDPRAPSPGLALFTRAVQGMADYCAGLAAGVPDGDPARVLAWARTHEVEGLSARDERTVVVVVNEPVGDFLNTLALPYATPLPEEILGGLTPGDPALRGRIPSLGPYTIAPGSGPAVTLLRNPAWRADTDPLRRAWADRIELRPVATVADAAGEVAAGRADIVLGGTPVDAVAAAVADPLTDARVRSAGDGSLDLLTARLDSGSACGTALADPRVRLALALGVDRQAAAVAAGAPLAAEPAGSLLPTAILGHDAVDPFATPGSAGDPVAARSLLAAARPGTSTSTPLRCAVSVSGDRRLVAVAAALRPPLLRVGIDLHPRAAGERADLTVRRWLPPWRGNAGRGLLEELLGSCAVGSGRCYAGQTFAATALAAAAAENDQNRAAARWAEAAAAVLQSVPVVPLVQGRSVSLTSDRVSGYRWFNLAGDVDLPNTAVPSR